MVACMATPGCLEISSCLAQLLISAASADDIP